METKRMIVMFYQDQLEKANKKASIFNHPKAMKWGMGWDDENCAYQSPDIFNVKHFLSVEKSSLDVLDENLQIIDEMKFADIKKVSISICSREGTYHTLGVKTSFSFQVDLDIEMKSRTCLFEVLEPNALMNFISKLNQHCVMIDDPMNIIGIFREHPDVVGRLRYLQYNFKSLAEKFNLDNPRK